MKVTEFAARADLVGRRVRVAWTLEPDEGETVADAPPLVLRRKLRDWAFPAPAMPDPFVVYDATAFPPPPVPDTLSVTDLDSWEVVDDATGLRTVYEPISVAVSVGPGRMVEVLRRTIGTSYDSDGVARRQRVEILDVGRLPGDLQANTVYYYQLFGHDLPADGDDAAPYRGAALVTDAYGINRTLYDSLPEIYRRHDVTARPKTAGSETVPEAASRGQLRRFTDIFGIALDSLRGTADGLRGLRDIDGVDARYLPELARWIGWELGVGTEAPVQRNEIKTAGRLYRLVGTLPGLRTLVHQHTGWSSQVAELAQNLALANRPPQRNLYAVTIGAGAGSHWHGVDDAAELLGFGAANQQAVGGAGSAATLTSGVAEPFTLRPGLELTLSIDGGLPLTVRFGADDFVNLGAAAAAEVAAAMARALPDVVATASAGRLVLASPTVGPASSLVVTPAAASLVSLEAAPNGRLSAGSDSHGRLRLFYEAWRTPTQPEAGAPVSGTPAPADDSGSHALRQVRYKTFVDGAWRDSRPMYATRSTMAADPAALVLPGDRVAAAWIDSPGTAAARVRLGIGASRPLQPARLYGNRREPFALGDGRQLTITGSFGGSDHYVVHAADFGNVARASAAEVVAAMNAQLTHAIAVRERNGSIRLDSVAGGDLATLAVDLGHSTTARALGFDARNAGPARGAWSDELDWGAPLDAVSIVPGRHAELSITGDPAGGARLAWATHHDATWRVAVAHWDERTLVASANGLFVRDGAGPWSSVAGLGSSDIRSVAVDADGSAWIATAAGVMLRAPNGTVSAPSPALPFANIRQLVFLRDGTLACALPTGVGLRTPAGATSTLTVADGLPANDVRALAALPDGGLWMATAAGAARRSGTGVITVIDAARGLPSNDVRDVALGPVAAIGPTNGGGAGRDGTVYFATALGLAVGLCAGRAVTIDRVVDAHSGLGSNDVRALAVAQDGTVWAATSDGVSRCAGGSWRTFDAASGLGSNDAHAVALAPDGSAWVGTAAGGTRIGSDDSVAAIDVSNGGGVTPAIRAVHTGWSAPRELGGGDGGNREPTWVVDGAARTWLLWSRRVGVGNPDESWTLRARLFDPATRTWGAEIGLTTPPPGARAADRGPGAQVLAGGLRVYFSSDRGGGIGLWSIDVSGTGSATAPVALPDDAAADVAPTPVSVGGATWILYRSDRNVALPAVGPLGSMSARVPDGGTVRRYAGTIAARPDDLGRLRTRRAFGDLNVYTPNRPAAEAPLGDDELYTRGTVALYVTRTQAAAALTSGEAARLRELLARFIPVNLRVVVVLVPELDAELVYPTAGVGESYRDDYPFLETLGAISDGAAPLVLPWSVLHASTAGDVSADPANLATLKKRTFFT